MTYDPGELEQVVSLQTETLVSDGAGGSTKTWVNTATGIKAHVRPMSGRERYFSDQIEANSNYLIVIRKRAVTEKQRLVWTSVSPNVVLNIRFVKLRPRSRYLEIEAEDAPT